VRNLIARSVASLGTIAVLFAGPSPAQAQWHGYGPGHSHFVFSVGVGFGFGWYPFYSPWYPWYPYRSYGWYPPYPGPYGYPYYPYYPYGYTMDTLTASLRLEVKPSDADVYVDGYMAGKVDNFDGMFQRLHVRPGDHDLTLFKDGYHEVQQHLYLAPNSDQKVQFVMQPLASGEANDSRPAPNTNESNPTTNEPDPNQQGQPPPGYGGRGAPPPYQPGSGQPGQQMPPGYGRGEPPPQPQPQPQEPRPEPQVQVDPRSFGTLSLLVQPADAEILLDGAKWPAASSGESRIVIQMPEGRHHIEISKDGFARYVEDVGIQRGRTLSLNVSLIHRPGGGE
jgi:hypothetical protein